MADEQTLSALSQRDAQAAALQPTGIPEGWEDHVFQTPDLPQGTEYGPTLFTLRNIKTLEDFGPFRADDFVTDPTTGITTAHTSTGQPVILRVRRQWRDQNANTNLAMECVNEDGTFSVLYVVPLGDNALEIEEPNLMGATHPDGEFDIDV